MKWPGTAPRIEPAFPGDAFLSRGSRPAVFLDKDGTLVAGCAGTIADPACLRFTANAFEGLRLLRDAGFALVVVTHQAGIAEHRFARQAFARVEAALVARLGAEGLSLEGLHLCPHRAEARPGGACLCRTPAPGLLRQAAIAHRLHLPSSWMIGDTLDDIEAGHRAACRSVLLDVGSETAWRQSPLRRPDHRCTDLLAAAEFIVSAAPQAESTSDWSRIPSPPSRLAGTRSAAAFGSARP